MLKNDCHILLILSDPVRRRKYHHMAVLGVAGFTGDFP